MSNADFEMASRLVADSESDSTLPSVARPTGRAYKVAVLGGFAALALCGLAAWPKSEATAARPGSSVFLGSLEDLKDQATDAVGQATDAASEATDNLQDAAGEVQDAAGDAADSAQGAVAGVADQATDAVEAGQDQAADAAGAVQDAAGDASGAVEDAAGAAQDQAADLAGSVQDAAGNVAEALPALPEVGDGMPASAFVAKCEEGMELWGAVCYKTCASLTDGKFTTRMGAATCCASEDHGCRTQEDQHLTEASLGADPKVPTFEQEGQAAGEFAGAVQDAAGMAQDAAGDVAGAVQDAAQPAA